MKVIFAVDTGSENSRELQEIHDVPAGVVCEVFFDDLTSEPAHASNKASENKSVGGCLDKLVVGRHGIRGEKKPWQAEGQRSSSEQRVSVKCNVWVCAQRVRASQAQETGKVLIVLKTEVFKGGLQKLT